MATLLSRFWCWLTRRYHHRPQVTVQYRNRRVIYPKAPSLGDNYDHPMNRISHPWATWVVLPVL